MIKITEMTEAHIESVSQIEEECFSIPWSKADFERELTVNNFAYYFVAEDDGKVVGYAGLWHIITEGHITNVAVLPEYRRQGIGALLIDRIIQLAKQKEINAITLEVRISNGAAQKLYTGKGFKPEGFRKNYYADSGEDAVIMWLYL